MNEAGPENIRFSLHIEGEVGPETSEELNRLIGSLAGFDAIKFCREDWISQGDENISEVQEPEYNPDYVDFIEMEGEKSPVITAESFDRLSEVCGYGNIRIKTFNNLVRAGLTLYEGEQRYLNAGKLVVRFHDQDYGPKYFKAIPGVGEKTFAFLSEIVKHVEQPRK